MLKLCIAAVVVGLVTCKICPGGKLTCGNDETCCKYLHNKYTCCPLPNAVCCSDLEHCCPHGYVCDNETSACKKPNHSLLQPALSVKETKVNEQYVVCDNGSEFICPTDFTCCKTRDHFFYNCCPMPDAVCCQDGEHCCPSGTRCDFERNECISESIIKKIPLLKYVPPYGVGKQKLDHHSCSNSLFSCPSYFPCCQLSEHKYACCPIMSGVCCEDREHCCPKGTACGDKSVCVPLQDTVTKAGKIVCPGGNFTCPTGYSCCMGPDSQWTCCPLLNAVCCKDNVHCCPSGSVCNHLLGKCDTGLQMLPWSRKSSALPMS